jgi:hypothetical protein
MNNDINIGVKYKIVFDIVGTVTVLNNKGIFILQDDYISLKITDSKDKEEVMNNLKSMYFEEECYLIKYALIKKVLIAENKFRLEIFNPSMLKCIFITVNNTESVGMLFNKTLGNKSIDKLINYIKARSQYCKKNLIEHFILFINVLSKEVQSDVIEYINHDKFLKGINESKKYYDKSMLDLRELDRKKLKFSKKLITSTKRTQKNVDESTNVNMFSNIISDFSTMKVYTRFENLYNEIKTRASLLIDESIFLLLNVINVEPSKLKKVDKNKIAFELKNLYNITECKTNKSDNCILKINHENRINREFDIYSSFSTNTNSIKDKKLFENKIIETPKFRANMVENSENKLTQSDILVKINEMKSNHIFLTPDSKENIIHNSIEIIYRKFFENSFQEFFPKLFIFEKDTKLDYDFLKLDCLFSYFMYLKNLKSYLFTFENKIQFADLFFQD